MNVNILENNPDWHWYLLFLSMLLLLTLIAWLFFKYTEVSKYLTSR